MDSPRWTLLEVDWNDERARELRARMDAELNERYAERFAQLEPALAEKFGRDFALDPGTVVSTVIGLGADGALVGHAALRQLGTDLEVKRVFVAPSARGSGVSRAIMADLERIASRRGVERLILQTGDRQPEAVALYTRIGYSIIPIFAPYADWDFSLCFEKRLAGGRA